MQVFRRSLTATACMFALSSSISAAPSKADIAAVIKADVAEIVAGINAHDPDRTTRFDAADVIGIEAFNAPIMGAKADKDGFAAAFKESPSWRVGMIDETVDVADAGDMAVYRSTYHEDSSAADGTPMTHKVSFLAGFTHHADGAWRMHWYVVCAQERSHKK
jgi:ketosteroid isomerase-like protein